MAGSYKQLRSYSHTQSTPSAIWNITHNLNGIPVVDVFIDVSGTMTKILPLEVNYINANTVQIQFVEARSGTAKIVA